MATVVITVNGRGLGTFVRCFKPMVVGALLKYTQAVHCFTVKKLAIYYVVCVNMHYY